MSKATKQSDKSSDTNHSFFIAVDKEVFKKIKMVSGEGMANFISKSRAKSKKENPLFGASISSAINIGDTLREEGKKQKDFIESIKMSFSQISGDDNLIVCFTLGEHKIEFELPKMMTDIKNATKKDRLEMTIKQDDENPLNYIVIPTAEAKKTRKWEVVAKDTGVISVECDLVEIHDNKISFAIDNKIVAVFQDYVSAVQL